MIRECRAADLARVLDIWYRASIVAHSFLPDEFFTTERELLRNRWLPSSETFVYEIEGEIVAFLSLVGNEVGGLFVDPDHQQRGIGRALMDSARVGRSVLELSVFAENHSALAFYAAYGFEIVGRQVNADTGHPELLMRLDTTTG